MNLHKQNIYVTSADNDAFWDGYLNGTVRWGYVIIKRKVYDIAPDLESGGYVGRVKTPAGYRQVSTFECPVKNESEWSFDLA